MWFWFAFRKVLIPLESLIRIALCLLPQLLGIFWFGFAEHLETCLLQQELFDLTGRSPRVQAEWIFADQSALRVITIKQPLARFDGNLLIGHGGRHVNTVGDAV